ncbi:MFS general substrate transporter [Rhizoclosmatium globosum]|uniref:MFS general substrate transporter n=1 Tax=Rhizoclosmatium globosum TaxID=329046 RepID=A0A1Y2C512_9FUNG|nr:MFS general substrate transporter [Rhizoclosmatium globosum]|eukprot:ORY41967.1 MFS general substrate transporter [Rhizoclosmatium globosum]
MESKPNPEEERILLPTLTTNYGTSPPNVKEPSKQTFYIESSKDSEVSVPLPRVQFILAIASLFIAIFLVSLDNTIVSTALRGMIMDLGKQELAPWVGSAYMVTSAGFATLYGRFADIFGRKWVFMFAMAMFEIGSLICGVAQTMETLIVGRAIAGVGGGGMNAMVLIMISDIVSIRDRGKYQGLVGAAVGVASILGPIVGGAFSDSSVSWRWCFYINIPFGMVAMGVVSLLRFPPFTGNMAEKLKRIDYFGALTIFLAILCLICPLQLGGSTWEWNSAPVLIMFPLSAVFFAIFVFVELRMAKDPIVPAGMFVNQNVPTLLAYAISLGAIFFSAIYFISMFFQVVFNNTATQAGVSTIPLVLGMVVTTIGSGIFVSKTEKYVPLLYAGPVFMVIGATLTAFLDGVGVYGLTIGPIP